MKEVPESKYEDCFEKLPSCRVRRSFAMELQALPD
jgi:hypothetical protein